MRKKQYFEEFRRNGVEVTRKLILNGTYTGKPMEWAEGWIARRRVPWLGLTIGLLGVCIGFAGWLFPR